MSKTDIKASINESASESNYFAALDLGSNSFHLLIARLVEGQLQPLLKFKQPVQLGEGVASRQLSETAMGRGIEALRQCAVRLEGFAPESVKVVATHTLRRAKNRQRFVTEAAKVLPYPIEIISGREEARLIYLGVSETSAGAGNQLVIDIGGGSTEFAIGREREPDFLSSRSMGSLVCTESFFKEGKITAKRFNKAVIFARQQTEPVANYLAEHPVDTVFGTSGTIKAIHQWIVRREGEQPRGISLAQLEACRDELIDAKHADNLPEEVVSIDRRASIAGGVAVLIGIFRELGLERLVPHDAALREGVLYELAAEVLSHQDVRERTISSIAQRYSVDGPQAHRVLATVEQLWADIAVDWGINTHDLEVLLDGAAMLHEVGLSISSSGVQKHSGYILANAYMPGFNSEEQRFLATLARFYRKKIRINELPEFVLFSRHQLVKLLMVLRLAVVFNSDRQNRSLLEKAHADGNQLSLIVQPAVKEDAVLLAQLESEIKAFHALGYKLKLL